MIEVHDVRKKFGDVQALGGVGFSARDGQITALLGPNGAGKTTSFHMIVGLVAVDDGRIELNGADITQLPIDARAALGLGYLPQESSVFRKLTVADNLRAVLEIVPGLTPHQREIRLQNLLEQFHIEHIAGRLGETLSGGERRRTEIARALATDPKLVLLDEPTAGMNPQETRQAEELIFKIRDLGLAVVVIEHDMRFIFSLCDRVLCLVQGSALIEGTPGEVQSDPRVIEAYIGGDDEEESA